MNKPNTKSCLLFGCILFPSLVFLLVGLLMGGFYFYGGSPPADIPLLVDQHGRVVLYHGVNVSNYAKHAPDFLPWQTREDFQILKKWGINLVRLLVFWEAIEPEPDQYDEDYLAAVKERISWLEELGIDVLLDLHQDLYAQAFRGNGFPSWTIHDGGYDFMWREPWNLNYFSRAVRTCYRNFWESDELRNHYIEMVTYLLKQVEGIPNVIGLEIMNEPWPAPLLGFERKILSPFYEEIQARRRRESLTTSLYFEPVIYTSAGIPSCLNFTPEPDSVYAPHYYDPFCHEGIHYGFLGKKLMRTSIHIKMKEAKWLGIPLLYTEFGISPNVEGYGAYLDDFTNLLRTYHIGWICYAFDKEIHCGFGLLDADGMPREELLSHYISIYPQRIAGQNQEIKYTDSKFHLAYDPIMTNAPTVIAIPERFSHARVYVNGTQVSFDPTDYSFKHISSPSDHRQVIEVMW